MDVWQWICAGGEPYSLTGFGPPSDTMRLAESFVRLGEPIQVSQFVFPLVFGHRSGLQIEGPINPQLNNQPLSLRFCAVKDGAPGEQVFASMTPTQAATILSEMALGVIELMEALELAGPSFAPHEKDLVLGFQGLAADTLGGAARKMALLLASLGMMGYARGMVFNDFRLQVGHNEPVCLSENPLEEIMRLCL